MAAKTSNQRSADKADEDLLRAINDELGRAKRQHDARCSQYRGRYRAWTGVLERENDVWESQLAPKYGFQKIDTLIANLVDRQPTGKVLPCKQGADDFAAAKAMEKVLNEFRRRDRDYASQRQHVQQACVMGLSPRKNFWRYERGSFVWKELEAQQAAPPLELGAPPKIPAPNLVEKRGDITRWNQPVSRVVPVEDFFWDPSASHVEDCAWMAARYWVTPNHLKMMADAGVYDKAAVAKACQTRSGRKSSDVGIGPDSVDRAGRIELIEYWERAALVTVANRTVILRKVGAPNEEGGPFWHGELPFDIATTMPDLYRVEGFSEIELIAELQAAMWDFLNQRIDNARFMSNAALIVQEGTTVTEEGIYPGAIITTDGDPRNIIPWTPPTNIIEASIQATTELKQDMDDVTGVTPYVSGAGSQTLDQQTATQISTFQGMAAKRLESKRTMLFQSEQDRGMQRLALTQQFLTSGVEIRNGLNADGSGYEFDQVLPQQIVTAMLEYEIDETNESMDRQQRRQEALTLSSVFIQLAVAGAQLPSPSGKVIDLVAVGERLMQAFDLPPETVIKTPPPPDPMQQLAAMAQQGQIAPQPGILAGPGGPSGSGPPPPPPPGGNGAVTPLPPPPGVMSAQ